MKRIIVICIAILMAFFHVVAQNKSIIPGALPARLKIGDPCPDILISGVINCKTPTLHLSDFKGKWIILDFWATWCGPCIKALPELDSLQRLYKDRIQIIAVTAEPIPTVKKFLANMSDARFRNFHLPIVTDDRQLNYLFEHNTIPHEVWIDENGIIRSFTDAVDVNVKNIASALSKKRLNLKVKNDKKYYEDRPLLMGGIDSNLVDLQYNSVFIGYVKGLPSSFRYRENSKFRKIADNNAIIQNLVKDAFAGFDQYLGSFNRSRLEVKDSTKFYYWWHGRKMSPELKDSLSKISSVCYELIVPATVSKAEAFKLMQQDVNRFIGIKFGLESFMEKRDVKCLVAKRTDNTINLKAKGDTTSITANAFGLHMRNQPLDLFFQNLAGLYLQTISTPIINDTGYSENVDLDINAHLNNVEEIKAALKKYGIELIEEVRNIPMIIIRDKN